MDERNRKKFSEIKKGSEFSDGSIVKKKYFFKNDSYIVFLDKNNEIKFKILDGANISHALNKLKELALVEGELILLPNMVRKDLNRQLAYIYKLALSDEEINADKALQTLKTEIYARKKILKQFIYLIAPILCAIIFVALFTGIKLFFSKEFLESNKEFLKFANNKIFIFTGIGSFLSISKNINKIQFESSENVKFYFGFAFFKYLFALFSAEILIILYESKIINIKVETSSPQLFLNILIILGSFSETLIPNIFGKLEKKVQVET